MITQASQPFANTTDGPVLYFLGLPTYLRATAQTTNGGFGLVDSVMPPGFASPYHTHHREDEAFYVVDGDMAFVCGDRWTIAGPGTFVFGPRGVAHGFKVLGNAPAHLLLLCTPGGFEEFVVELSDPAPAPPDMARLTTAAAKFGIDVHGPLPEQADAPSESKSAKSATALEDEVARIRARHVAAVNAGDLEAALEIFAPDAAVMPPGQPALAGASLRAWYIQVFSHVRLQGFDLRPDAVEQYGQAAIEHGTWSATLHPKDGSPSQPVGGAYLTTYARQADGVVRVTRDMFHGMPGESPDCDSAFPRRR